MALAHELFINMYNKVTHVQAYYYIDVNYNQLVCIKRVRVQKKSMCAQFIIMFCTSCGSV